MSSDISILASRRELLTLIEYADYSSMNPGPILLQNGEILDHHDLELLYRVFSRQEFLFPRSGLGIVRVPGNLDNALVLLRRSMRKQGVGVRPSKLTGTSLIGRMAVGLLLRERVVCEV